MAGGSKILVFYWFFKVFVNIWGGGRKKIKIKIKVIGTEGVGARAAWGEPGSQGAGQLGSWGAGKGSLYLVSV